MSDKRASVIELSNSGMAASKISAQIGLTKRGVNKIIKKFRYKNFQRKNLKNYAGSLAQLRTSNAVGDPAP